MAGPLLGHIPAPNPDGVRIVLGPLTIDLARPWFAIRDELIDIVLIAPDVTNAEAAEVQGRQITLRLRPEAVPAHVVWELSQLFPRSNSAVH